MQAVPKGAPSPAQRACQPTVVTPESGGLATSFDRVQRGDGRPADAGGLGGSAAANTLLLAPAAQLVPKVPGPSTTPETSVVGAIAPALGPYGIRHRNAW